MPVRRGMKKRKKVANANGPSSVMDAIAAELAKRGMVALTSAASGASSEEARRKKKAKKAKKAKKTKKAKHQEKKHGRERERTERERTVRALELAGSSDGSEEAETVVAKKRRLPAVADVAEDISTRDITLGQGFEAVRERSRVRVLYCGKLLPSGRVFDRNDTAGKKPLEFVVGDEDVIEGFEDGVVGMRPGGQRVIEVPPSRGYGDSPPPGSKIPIGARLQFTVTLLGLC